ncbi:Uncharacterized protein APZ42_001381 [Daphnia magna]|uniref:Uncharacterized protein n=1 Tax=Daphnia magna TaxID=35525 RepID=A0A164J0Y3_9CRUS|nr:Uncharacterized protein APZ42_001381 [Daphnia magna]
MGFNYNCTYVRSIHERQPEKKTMGLHSGILSMKIFLVQPKHDSCIPGKLDFRFVSA